MRTIYSYEELSYNVQQEVKARTLKTKEYEKYLDDAKHEYLRETAEDFFTDYMVSGTNQIYVDSNALEESTSISVHPAIDRIQLLLYVRDVNFIFSKENVLTLEQLKDVTKSAKEMREKLIDIINEIRDRIDNHEPDFEQYVQNNWYTEDGHLVTIEE